MQIEIHFSKRNQEEIEYLKKMLKARNNRPLPKGDHRQSYYSRKFGPALMMAMAFLREGREDLAEERLALAYWYGKVMGNRSLNETLNKIRTREFTNLMQIHRWYNHKVKEKRLTDQKRKIETWKKRGRK